MVVLSVESFYYKFMPALSAINREFVVNSRILIDMPVSLPYAINGTLISRDSDFLARRILGKKGASIFNSPCFEALYENNYEAASRTNYLHTGKKLSKQTWNIMPGIRDVDRFVASNRIISHFLLEAHPELSLLRLNNMTPLKHSKKTPQGIVERVEILKKWYPLSEIIFFEMKQSDIFRKTTSDDDLVDALVLAILNYVRKDNLESLPLQPKAGHNGLPMAIWW